MDGTGSSQQLIVHWYDYYDDAAYDIKEMYFNGQHIDSAISVGPLQHTVKVYNVQKMGFSEIKPGDIWTINVILYDGLTVNSLLLTLSNKNTHKKMIVWIWWPIPQSTTTV